MRNVPELVRPIQLWRIRPTIGRRPREFHLVVLTTEGYFPVAKQIGHDGELELINPLIEGHVIPVPQEGEEMSEWGGYPKYKYSDAEAAMLIFEMREKILALVSQ